MTRTDTPIREADLVAYADGRLDADRAARVEAHLAGNEADARSVDVWRQQNETIHELYDRVSREPVPPRLDVRRMGGREAGIARSFVSFAAAAVLLLAMGAAGGWFAHGLIGEPAAGSAELVGEALAAHRLYSTEVVHPVEVAATQEAHLAKWLSKRLDRPLEIPDLRATGFNLVGGRLLPAGERPAAQFMYEDASGRRVTLYIVPASLPGETAFHFASNDKLGAFYWRDARITCAIVGDLPREDLQTLAKAAYRQLG